MLHPAFVAVAFAAAAASASDDPARTEARRLAQEGDAAFSTGRCDRAIPLWQRAESTFHAPTILLRIARCQGLIGHVVDATATLEALASEKLAEDAPEPFVLAQKQAASELDGMRARIAHITVRVAGSVAGRGQDAALRIDGQPALIAAAYPVDPGTHQIRIVAGDGVLEQSAALGDGEARTVDVRIETIPGKKPIATQRIVGYSLGGVGLALMAVGAVFGTIAVQSSHDLNVVCGPDRKSCPPDRQKDLDALKDYALASDLMIGGGAALFIGGAAMLLTVHEPTAEPPRVRVVPFGAGLRVVGAF